MTSILMVCLGNICRSPLAHGIFQSKLSSEFYYVDSAGTAAYHIGEQPDKRSVAVAKSNGIDISLQSARQFKVSDFDTFNVIYAMDLSNYTNVINLARNTNDIAKVKLILEEDDSISNKNVPDPYYGNMSDFEYVFNILNSACENIVKKIR
jgi:protein-tyrosine phosphatase